MNLILNLNVEQEFDLGLAIYASHDTSLMMAAGAYRVVTLCAHLTRDLSAIAKYLVLTPLCTTVIRHR